MITGASSGLGWAVVEALAHYKVHFCMLSRREESMKALAAQLSNSGSTFWWRSCDVRDRNQVYAAVHDFHRSIGRIDVAWVNSGIGINASFHKWNWERVEETINTNLKGAIYTIRTCLEIMVPQKYGAIVAIGSAAAMRGLPTRSIYSVTKIGLEYLLQSLAAELPEIQFSMIHPGWVETPISSTNSNKMWVLKAPKAARLMIKAVAKRKRFYVYPFRMKLLFRLARILPLPMYYRLTHKLIHIIRRSKD